MELVYLWIEDFANIHNCEFNFGHKYVYHFNKTSKTIALESQKEEYIKDFFGANIINLSAIIGKNGTGKSSLLNAICLCLSSISNGYSSEVPFEFVAIFNDSVVYKKKNLLLYPPRNYKVYNSTNDNQSLFFEVFNDAKVVYYTNVFDYKSDYFDLVPNLIDISTNHLIIEDSRHVDSNNNEKILLYDFVSKELQRTIHFISKFKKIFDFPLPNIISISIKNEIKRYKNLIKKLPTIERNQYESLPYEDKRIYFYNKVLESFKTLIENRDEVSIDLEISDLLNGKENIKHNDYENKVIEYFALLNKMIQNHSLIHGILGPSNSDDENESELYFNYTIKSDNSDFFNLMNIYFSIVKDDSFIYTNWDRELSSGEKAFLLFFSRIFYAKNQIDYKNNKNYKPSLTNKRTLIITLDEIDLYLHPEWQKILVKLLISKLPEIFKGFKIQLFISSHSPIILSDIPKSNCLFLTKNSDTNNCIVSNNTEHKESFGANIHDLYKDAFFMGDGLIGEFAKDKINNLIKFLIHKPVKYYGLYRETSQQLINYIGEPIIKNHLQDMWNEKFQKNYNEKEELLEIIQKLERENKRLRNETN